MQLLILLCSFLLALAPTDRRRVVLLLPWTALGVAVGHLDAFVRRAIIVGGAQERSLRLTPIGAIDGSLRPSMRFYGIVVNA